MSPRKSQPCYGIQGEGCPAIPSYEYQPYPNVPARPECGVHAEQIRKHYVRSKRLRKLLPDVLRPLPETSQVDAREAVTV